MNTLIGGIFCENGKEIGKVIGQRPEKGKRTAELGRLAASEAKDSIRITIEGGYVAGGGVNGKEYKCEVVIGTKRIKVTVEDAKPKARGKTTDIILSIP